MTREEALSAARGKVEEAEFFLSKMRETEAPRRGLPANDHEFGWYLSAFLSAARSAHQVVAAHEGQRKGLTRRGGTAKDDWGWADIAKGEWFEDDRAFYRTMKNLRDLNVHRAEGGADSAIELVSPMELPRRESDFFEAMPQAFHHPLWPTVKVPVRKFTLTIDTKPLPALEVAAKYLELVKAMISHYFEANP